MTCDATTEARIAALPKLFRLAVEKKLILKNRSPKTVSNALSHLVPFADWLAEQGIDPEAVTGDDLDSYFAGHKGAPRTVREAIKRIRFAYAYALKRGDLGVSVDPFILSEFEPPKPPDAPPATITAEELRHMLHHSRSCSENARTLLLLLAYTGCRVDEIRRMMWADVNWQERTVSVLGKGNKHRTVPLHPNLYARLVEVKPVLDNGGAVLSGNPRLSHRAGGGHPYQSLNKLRLEFTDHPFHSFRRTAATSLGRNRVEERLIFKVFGWERKTIFSTYYDATSVTDLHDAISNLYADDPIGA